MGRSPLQWSVAAAAAATGGTTTTGCVSAGVFMARLPKRPRKIGLF